MGGGVGGGHSKPKGGEAIPEHSLTPDIPGPWGPVHPAPVSISLPHVPLWFWEQNPGHGQAFGPKALKKLTNPEQVP